MIEPVAIALSLLACAAPGVALLVARRGAATGTAGQDQPAPPPPATNLPPAQEAALLEALCQDIRQRTNGIVGLSELLLAAPLLEDQLRQAELIADSGRTMLRLLGDVLDVTRIDAGGLQLQSEPSDPRDLLGHSVNLMQASASARGLSLVLVVDDAVPRQIALDRARLRQVLLNLIGNAVKFTRQGRIDVQARVAQTPAGSQLAISVIDPGVGIAREKQEEIFQPFFRRTAGSANPAADSTGTGLGLALSSRIVRAMGGEISLESAPGLGSCFTVRLPLVADAAPLVPHEASDQAWVLPVDPPGLHQLEARYRQRKEALFASLQAATLPDPRWPETNWESLTSQLQGLAGVAANFGDAHLGNLARRLCTELHHHTSPRLRQEAVLRQWDELQAARRP